MEPGRRAAEYEVEINSAADFASAAKVCCSSTPISTSLAPSTVLPANTYYWRVRAIDANGHAGEWNVVRRRDTRHVHDAVNAASRPSPTCACVTTCPARRLVARITDTSRS